MADIGTAYVKIEPTAKGISSKISGELEAEGKSGGKAFSGGFGSVISGVGKVAVGAIAAGAAAVGGIVKSAVSSFGEYEQLVGGVETLFGDASDTVIKNADQAFQTAGVSANEYMQTVTSFSASLLQSVGNDTTEAAKVADMALVDMADNANKMGTSMESIQNAYQGFAKQNYTMLDNLKLGYGGTKTEMQRLLADAEKFSGVKYDISNLNDVYEAIHVIQGEMHISGRSAEEAAEIIARTGRSTDEVYEQMGTTAKEAATTLQGSMASMKAAWTNMLAGMGTEGANMDALINNLLSTVETFAGNIMPVIETALTGVSTLVGRVAPVLAERLPALITQALPGLLQSGVKVIESLGNGILQAIPTLMPTITDIIMQIVNMLVSMAPQLIQVGMQVILELANGLGAALPTLIPTIVTTMLTIVDTLISNVDLLVDAAVAIIIGLSDGLVAAMPTLIQRLPEIVIKIVNALVQNAPKLIDAAVSMVVALTSGFFKALPDLIDKLPEVVATIVNGLISEAKEMVKAGKALVDGLWKGISDNWGALASKVKEKGKELVDKVKGFFKIESPSRLMADEIGRWIPEGIAVGIEANADSVNNAIDSMCKEALVKPSYEDMASTANSVTSSIASGVEPTGNDSMMGLLTRYLPLLLDAVEHNEVTIEGSAKDMFNVIRKENNVLKTSTGYHALA